jgi:hypothetical protein
VKFRVKGIKSGEVPLCGAKPVKEVDNNYAHAVGLRSRETKKDQKFNF